MDATCEVDTGYRQTQTLKRDIIFDQDNDGTWAISVYQAGNDHGGGLRFADEVLALAFRELMHLFLDPDRYGSQTAVLRKRSMPVDRDAA